MNQSLQLAKLWTVLDQIKDQLDNVGMPLGSHLNLDDPNLMIAMEALSEKINDHFSRFRLVAELRRTEQG